MPTVLRLVTVVDLDDDIVVPPEVRDAPMIDGPPPEGFEPAAIPIIRREPQPYDPRHMSFSALHLAVLDDGRRLTLLDDRGWGGSGPPDVWQRTTVEEIEDEARMVVGPDEPYYDDETAESMAVEHWDGLADTLRRYGIQIDGAQLRLLPHDVELTDRVRERLQGQSRT